MRRWRQAREGYRAFLFAQGRSPDTIENAIAALNLFERFCLVHEVRPLRATEPVISYYIAWLHENRARATVRNRLVNLKLFWCYAQAEEFTDDNPLACVKPPLVRAKAIRPYAQRELQRLLGALRKPRDHALFFLYVGTGLRSSEVLRLKVEDIDFIAGTVRVIGKGGKSLVSCPGLRAMAAVRVYMAIERIRAGWVFPGRDGRHLARSSLYAWIRCLARRAGVQAANIHRFRHTFGHQFLEAGGGVGDLQILLGHSNVSTTLQYVAFGAASRALEAQRRLNPADRL